MVESLKTVISDEETLSKLIGEGIEGGTIYPKLVMPRPGDVKRTVVRFLYTKTKDGRLGVLDNVKNEQFATGEAYFFNVEDYDKPGVTLQVGAGKSMGNSVKRMCTTNGWKLTDIPGKVAEITASYYNKIPCNKCRGSGSLEGKKCVACEGTGKSTVFNVVARLDLMNAIPKDSKKADEF